MLSNLRLHKHVIIEGNIGAGKSTFLAMVGKYLNVQMVFEPITKWQNVNDSSEDILARFYTDSKRWAYSFETYAFITRIMEQEELAKKNPYQCQIVERSVYSDRYCFAQNCYQLGFMSEIEWCLYKEWFAWLVDNYTVKPSGFIYLQTDPDICYQRLLKRKRSQESQVSLDYIQSLHARHQEWLVDKINVGDDLKDVPVLTLECNRDFEHNIEEQERHIEKIVAFLSAHHIVNVSIGKETLFFRP